MILNYTTGVKTLGNTSGEDLLISSVIDTNVEYLKNVTNGVWASWTKGSPAEFQGFSSLKSGRGYIISALADTSVTIPDSTFDISNLNVSTGLNLLAASTDRTMGKGFVPGLRFGETKTIDPISGSWSSWTKNTDPAFQGFTDLKRGQAYVADVEEVYGETLVSGVKDRGEGVRIPEDDNTNVSLTDGLNASGIKYTDPNSVGTMSTISKTYNASTPALVLFAEINSKIIKLDFAEEYLGDIFYINEAGSKYVCTFEDNNDYANPTVFTETVDDVDALDLSYTAKACDLAGEMKTMKIQFGSEKSYLEYLPEYEGDPFKVFRGGEMYTGTFQESSTSVINLTLYTE